MIAMNEIDRQDIDPEIIIDYLLGKREFVLTVRTQDLEFIKGRLSQAKFKRGIQERMSMRSLDIYYLTGEVEASVTDLHIKLGSGTDVFIVRCSDVDNEL